MRVWVAATLLAAAIAACVSAEDGLAGGALLKSSLAVRQQEDFLSARAVCLNSTGDQYGSCSSLSNCCETSASGCCPSSQKCCFDNVGGCCPTSSSCCDLYCCDSSQVCVSGTCQSASSIALPIFPGAWLIGTLITGIIIIVLNVALLINDSITSSRCRKALARVSAAGPQWSPNCGLTQELHQVATTQVFLMTVQRKKRFAVIAIVFHVLSLVLAILALAVFYILMYPAYFFAFVGLSCSIASSCMRGASHDQLRRLAAGTPNTVAMTFVAQPQAVPVATAVYSSTGAPSPYPQAQYAAPSPQMQAPYPSQASPYPPQTGQYPSQQTPYPPQQAPYPPAAYAPGYAQPNAPPPAYESTAPNY